MLPAVHPERIRIHKTLKKLNIKEQLNFKTGLWSQTERSQKKYKWLLLAILQSVQHPWLTTNAGVGVGKRERFHAAGEVRTSAATLEISTGVRLETRRT